MIPTPGALQAALAPYLLYIRLAVYALIVAAIFGAGVKVGYGIAQARADARAVEQARDYQSALARAREAERASYAKSQEASRGYQANLAALDASYRDALRRIGPVRVCVSTPASGRVPAAGTATGRPHAADDRADVLAATGGDPGRDIAPDLIELARDADQCRARLTALQGWATGRQTTVPDSVRR